MVASVWASGEDLRRDEVRCLDNGEPAPLAKNPASTTVDGRGFELLLDGDYDVLNQLTCTGGGLEALRVSTRTPESRARTFIIGGAAATALLAPAGVVLWRATARTRRHEAAAANDRPTSV
ncbi:hypothetical protein MF406_04440 [Georgenia sp. TF02-10]|uniref:hypothetical protein n=1 Tax=Georgenia sp. TF02-10 TaxID=2917725 RepID=UPI001FA7146D|nr:hypothetical protein [Georgenia sp. TF02-10]UNX55517.1 hypothetical protein MF406_04440 [Georgenia sp. TF02-10]